MKEIKCLNCSNKGSLFSKICSKCGSFMETSLEDNLLLKVIDYVVEHQDCSINKIQMHFNLGFNRARQLVNLLEKYGVISEFYSMKPRKVLVSKNEMTNKL